MPSPTASVPSAADQLVDEFDEYVDAEKNFQPKSLKFWTIIIGIYVSIFLVALDRTIIATAIPSITDEFHSIKDIGWYGSAYMLTAACFNPISGRVYQLYSTKWVFIISIVIFEVGSALCGAAPSSIVFIIGRAIAGLGSAGIFTGGTMIILPLIPLRKRPVFTSFFGMVFWYFIESPKREKLTIIAQVKRLDPIGILFFVPSMVCLILALQWGDSTYSWSAPKIIGLLVTFAVLFVVFVVVEVFTPEIAMAPTRVVLNRSIAGSLIFMLLLSGGMMCVIYYLTIWFQVVKGDLAMHAGVSTIPLLLSLIIMGIVAAIFTQKIGYYVPAMLLSPVICSIGSGLLSTLSPSSYHGYWIGYQVLYGLGIGCGFQISTLTPQNVLPRTDVPLGMALMFFMQQLGGSIFLSVGQNIFSSKLVDSLSGIAGLDAEAIVNTGATDLRRIVPSSEISAVVDAYNYSLTRIFLLTAALSACMILGALAVEWKSIKGKGGPESPLKTTEAKLKERESEAKN
ncbi:hypothetical protein G7Y89_g5426 [Cudoniella acicularis]|uniref:Major facilitator superfamily (MFS) profile domain-containing protein n=1 Tax=Cudoniella acicularis TaxID=354080 RepID=A0A8H4W5Q8_9HELO|nr:hypothetical protein G7Y89_g5426 [Cudoniella acicularis]